MKACWIIDIDPSLAISPSVVQISLPSAQIAKYRQESTLLPSISTEQAPHSPTSHPFFTDVRPISLLKKSVREALLSTIFSTGMPLMVHATFLNSGF